MNKEFEHVGVNLQCNATSRENANKKFGLTCRICWEKGIKKTSDCNDCAIATAHILVVTAFLQQGNR